MSVHTRLARSRHPRGDGPGAWGHLLTCGSSSLWPLTFVRDPAQQSHTEVPGECGWGAGMWGDRKSDAFGAISMV